jgi:muconolactone delta-isomerase
MKFLVLQRIGRDVPIGMLTRLLPEQFKYLDGLEREGKIEVSYHLIGQQSNLLIVNVNSEEELSSVISQDPLFFNSEREVYPLTTLKAHKKYLKQLFKSLSKKSDERKTC